MSKQENISDSLEMAKLIAKTEREAGIERWMRIVIERHTETANEHDVLKVYDLPYRVYDKYRWVIRWRAARLQCQWPRFEISTYISPYHKVKGVNIGMEHDLAVYTSAKAKLTRARNILAEHIEDHRSDIFFDEETDELVVKTKAKIAAAEQSVREAEERLAAKVEECRQTINIKQTKK